MIAELTRRLGLEPEERRLLALMGALVAILFCAYTIAKVQRDAIFLHEFGALALPYAYVAVALTSVVFVWLEGRVARRFTRAPAPLDRGRLLSMDRKPGDDPPAALLGDGARCVGFPARAPAVPPVQRLRAFRWSHGRLHRGMAHAHGEARRLDVDSVRASGDRASHDAIGRPAPPPPPERHRRRGLGHALGDLPEVPLHPVPLGRARALGHRRDGRGFPVQVFRPARLSRSARADPVPGQVLRGDERAVARLPARGGGLAPAPARPPGLHQPPADRGYGSGQLGPLRAELASDRADARRAGDLLPGPGEVLDRDLLHGRPAP